MRFNISWLKDYLDTAHDVVAISERLTATGLEVEGIYSGEKLALLLTAENRIRDGKDGKDAISADVVAALKDDSIVEVNVTANRPDLAGVYGIARDLAAAGMGSLVALKVPAVPESTQFKTPIQVANGLPQDKTQHASQFVGRYIRGVNNTKQSSVGVRARLAAVGARSINPLVDVTNFFCFGFCRPLHVFDADTIVGNISVRHSNAGEKFTGLDTKQYELIAGLTVIADEAGILAVAGVMGGERSGCTAKTKNVFLEVALFDPVQTAKAGRALGITSAARYRFERGVDSQFVNDAEKLATAMILETCGGEAAAVCGFGAGFSRKSFAYQPADVKKIIGITIPAAKEREILNSLGIEFNAAELTNAPTKELSNKSVIVSVTVQPPSWRVDLTQSRDIVEELVRIVGFDAVPNEQLFPVRALSSRAALSPLQERCFAAQNSAARLGYAGSVTWSFMQAATAELFSPHNAALCLVNPIASDLNYLRPTALGNLMLAAKRNHARSISSVSLSEVGPGFMFENGEVTQHIRVAALRSGLAVERSWFERERNVDAFDVKGDLFAMLAEFGVDEKSCLVSSGLNSTLNTIPQYYHPGLAASVSLAGKIIAYFGVIHPTVRSKMQLDEPCAACEILLEQLPGISAAAVNSTIDSNGEFMRNDSQIVERDFSVLVAANVSAHEIELSAKNSVQHSGVALDTYSVQIFDRFSGKGIEPNKKSIAFSVRMQPVSGQTLESEAIEKISAAVFAGLEREFAAKGR